MDSEHIIFIHGIEQERRLEVKYFCRKRQREVVSICAPLHYSKGSTVSTTDAEDRLDCYYLWDFGAESDNNFLALSPSEIVGMELTEDNFCVQDLYGYIKQA